MRKAVFLRNPWLGLFILILPIIWCPATFAQDEQPLGDPTVEVLYDDGGHGLARAPLPGDVDLSGSATSRRRTKATVYAAYTSDHGTLTSSFPINGRPGDTYWQWLCPWDVFLYVSFVVDQPCDVTITWGVTGDGRYKNKWIVGPCLPGFLYFAYWQLSYFEDVPEGRYRVLITVKPNLKGGKKDSDVCKFWVVSCPTPP